MSYGQVARKLSRLKLCRREFELKILSDITGFVRYISSGEMTFGRLDWLPRRKGGLARGKNTRRVLFSDSSVPDVSSLCIVAHRIAHRPSVRVR